MTQREQDQNSSDWERERYFKMNELDQKMKPLLDSSFYSFLLFEDSDKIQLKSDDWPSDKWDKKLYIQTETSFPRPVTNIITRFIEINEFEFSYVFFMNYNFGLIKISNDALLTKWAALIEVDGDEIFCFIPNKSSFICIERTQEQIRLPDNIEFIWIYEVTFSNENFRDELVKLGE